MKRPAASAKRAKVKSAALTKHRWFRPPRGFKLQRPGRALSGAWPVEHLNAFDFPISSEVGRGPLLVDVLKDRGWRFSSNFCHWKHDKRTDHFTVWMREFEACLRGKAPQELFGRRGSLQEGYRLRPRRRPNRALWFMSYTAYRVPGTRGGRTAYRSDFGDTLVRCGRQLPGESGSYRIAKFPGTEPALFKTSLSSAFKDRPWWPRCYTLPEEGREFLRSLGGRGDYWITKPKNDYGGKGIKVWSATDPALRDFAHRSKGKAKSVVQKYLADPLLIAGFKFHMRIHLLITSLSPLQAFVQRNGQCLFATKPYTLAPDTLGASFEAPVHITNMSFNATDGNKENFLRAKPGIGKGQQFRVRKLEQILSRSHPRYSEEFLWGQVCQIAKEVVSYIARAPSVCRHLPRLRPQRHFELFGMDLMLDRDLNVSMCEVNTEPGLDYPSAKILGEPNPDFLKETGLSSDTWHDTLTLLGLDAGLPQRKGALRSWYQIDFAERKC